MESLISVLALSIREEGRGRAHVKQKRLKRMEVLSEIESSREIVLENQNIKAAHYLMVSVNDWERGQRHFPNPD